MKFISRALVVLVVQVAVLPAFAGICYPDGGGDGGCIKMGCAPELLMNNISKTDQILASLGESPEFASASEYRRQVALIGQSDKPIARMTRYFALVGVDSHDSKAVSEFVGQRAISATQVSLLMTNTRLTKAQSTILIESLVQGLRGDLQ